MLEEHGEKKDRGGAGGGHDENRRGAFPPPPSLCPLVGYEQEETPPKSNPYRSSRLKKNITSSSSSASASASSSILDRSSHGTADRPTDRRTTGGPIRLLPAGCPKSLSLFPFTRRRQQMALTLWRQLEREKREETNDE
ncbi:hypothetical protein niasHS_000664 [Heterodera schachtii]|uniref:Uncharacterized protein n=1 Tax=Heterodera schachtii TaxID=97005 RepID=A0ABD2K5N4_HETSC